MRWRRLTGSMGRWALTVATVALGAAWACSVWLGAALTATHTLDMGIGGGAFFVYRHPAPQPPAGFTVYVHSASRFRWMPYRVAGPVTVLGPEIVYGFPVWPPVLFCGAASAALWRRSVLRKRRSRYGLCVVCGYDRRGLAAGKGAACPECGTVPIK